MAYTRFSDFCVLAFCRLGVAGLSPAAPGTCGSLLALLVAPVLFLPLPLAGRAMLLALLLVAGARAATRAEQLLGRKDPGEIVIDELLGMWLVLLPFAEPNRLAVVWGFVLFRIFDMLKPWPIRALESRFPAGYGVMLDDAAAALYTLAVLGLLSRAGWL